MTPHAINKLLDRAAENIASAKLARERGRADVAMTNIKCARDITAAILDAHHAVDAQPASQTKTQHAPA
jgi:hypothetical protein